MDHSIPECGRRKTEKDTKDMARGTTAPLVLATVTGLFSLLLICCVLLALRSRGPRHRPAVQRCLVRWDQVRGVQRRFRVRDHQVGQRFLREQAGRAPALLLRAPTGWQVWIGPGLVCPAASSVKGPNQVSPRRERRETWQPNTTVAEFDTQNPPTWLPATAAATDGGGPTPTAEARGRGHILWDCVDHGAPVRRFLQLEDALGGIRMDPAPSGLVHYIVRGSHIHPMYCIGGGRPTTMSIAAVTWSPCARSRGGGS